MRVGILAIQHESNTFVADRTSIEAFRRDALLTGAAMADYAKGSRHEVGGFWHELEATGARIEPLLLALATPGGVLANPAADELIQTAVDRLRNAAPLDGVLVAPHGAAVSESYRDFDGRWLDLVRREVGRGVPIIGTLDPHANVSQQMIDATDALVSYRTNPHIDQFQTGQSAARLLLRTMRGEIRPATALVRLPLAISIDRQATSEFPCAELIRRADEMLRIPGVLSNSVVLGFPYADVEEMGTSILVVTDNQPQLARALAAELADFVLAHRKDFACNMPDVDAALPRVEEANCRVCLLDVGDNVGGGAAGDGTMLARVLHERRIGPSLVCLWDPESVKRASELGLHQRGELTMGGRVAIEQGPPLVAEVRVEWLGNGRFEETAPIHGGRSGYDMGPTAVVRTDSGVTVLLTSHRVPPFSLRQLTSCNLRPADFRVLVAKGVNAPIAAYRDVCEQFIRVNTPGVTCAEMTQLDFKFRRRPLFPFEELD